MYHVSAQGVDERMINVHYYYYYYNLCECCSFTVCTALFGLFCLSLLLRSRSSLVVGLRGPTRCVVTIVCLCTRQFTMYTTETAFDTFITCRCGLYFFQFDKSLSADMQWVFCPLYLPLSVTVNAPSPHPPSLNCHPGIIVNSKFCHGWLWGAKDCYI